MVQSHWVRRALVVGIAIIAVTGCGSSESESAEESESIEETESTEESESAEESESVDSESVVLPLPNGFAPDGITISGDGTVYVASIADGTIVTGSVTDTEIVDVLVEGEEGRAAWGLDLDDGENSLFVGGGFAGTARIYDAETGALKEEIPLTTEGGIVNDVIVTANAAYFTNSGLPELYEIPIDANGDVAGEMRVIPLTGDFEFDAENFANANGIDVLGNGMLIVNHSFLGKYYSVDITTGVATEIGLGGEMSGNDGLALDGLSLYGVEPPDNQVAEFTLSEDLSEATLVRRFSDDAFDFPTLIAVDDSYVYVVNGKLSTESAPDVPYEIIRIPR